MQQETIGYIHSIETMATLDGPGLRTIVFTQGCPLKCKYCHNVDSTLKIKRKPHTVSELLEKILKNREYWGKYRVGEKIQGGVTISGGDPIYQPKFVSEVFAELKSRNIHTAIDTSLYTTRKIIEMLIENIDLWMVSIKHFNEEKHKELTGVPNRPIFENLTFLDEQISKLDIGSKIRLRYVVLPGVTDKDDQISQLISLAKSIKNLDTIELLPYSSIGKHKWIEIFGKYDLEDVREGTKEDAKKIADKLTKENLPSKY